MLPDVYLSMYVSMYDVVCRNGCTTYGQVGVDCAEGQMHELELVLLLVRRNGHLREGGGDEMETR